MKQVQLLFSTDVMLEDTRNMKIDYSLTKNATETDITTPFYGVRITKYQGDAMEFDEVTGISTSEDAVISIIKKLYQHQVTPISMVEIVDELVTLGQ